MYSENQLEDTAANKQMLRRMEEQKLYFQQKIVTQKLARILGM